MLGLNCKAYRNTGTFDIPVWSEIDIIRDLNLPEVFDEAEVTTRGSGGRKEYEPTLLDSPIECEVLKKPADTNFIAIQAAFHGRTSLDLAIMDGDITTVGTQGLRGRFKIFRFEQNQPLADALKIPMSLKLCADDNPAEWMEIEA